MGGAKNSGFTRIHLAYVEPSEDESSDCPLEVHGRGLQDMPV